MSSVSSDLQALTNRVNALDRLSQQLNQMMSSIIARQDNLQAQHNSQRRANANLEKLMSQHQELQEWKTGVDTNLTRLRDDANHYSKHVFDCEKKWRNTDMKFIDFLNLSSDYKVHLLIYNSLYIIFEDT